MSASESLFSFRCRLADFVGWDVIEDGWFFYIGRLMVRWSRG